MFHQLPHEILWEVFSYLDWWHVIRVKDVSRATRAAVEADQEYWLDIRQKLPKVIRPGSQHRGPRGVHCYPEARSHPLYQSVRTFPAQIRVEEELVKTFGQCKKLRHYPVQTFLTIAPNGQLAALLDDLRIIWMVRIDYRYVRRYLTNILWKMCHE
jgi:hypothetical protein